MTPSLGLSARRSARSRSPKPLREQPHSHYDQNQRPQPPDPVKLEPPHGVEQEDNAQADQYDRAHGHAPKLRALTRAEGSSQPERIRRRLSQLNRLGRADGINDLVHVKERDCDSEKWPVNISAR